MLWTVFVILLVAWLILLVAQVTLGGAIHILFVAALAIGLAQIISGRQAF